MVQHPCDPGMVVSCEWMWSLDLTLDCLILYYKPWDHISKGLSPIDPRLKCTRGFFVLIRMEQILSLLCKDENVGISRRSSYPWTPCLSKIHLLFGNQIYLLPLNGGAIPVTGFRVLSCDSSPRVCPSCRKGYRESSLSWSSSS